MNESAALLPDKRRIFFKLQLGGHRGICSTTSRPPAGQAAEARSAAAMRHKGLRSITAQSARVSAGAIANRPPGRQGPRLSYVLSDFAKTSAMGQTLCEVIADNGRAAGAGRGRELPEQESPAMDAKGFRRAEIGRSRR